jgi:hypothetical protein
MRYGRARKGDRGASIVELALIAPVMAILVFGVLDLSRAYRMNIRLENAAREGAAFAQVYPNDVSCGPSGSIVGQVEAEDPGLDDLPGYEVVVLGQDDDGDWVAMSGCTGTVSSAGERVRVEVSVRYDIVTPLVAQAVGNAITLTGAAEVRVQGQVRP